MARMLSVTGMVSGLNRADCVFAPEALSAEPVCDGAIAASAAVVRNTAIAAVAVFVLGVAATWSSCREFSWSEHKTYDLKGI
jgi:hypothetical protein